MAEEAHTEAQSAHSEVPGGAEHHAVPTAFGIDPSGYVALSMIAVFLIMLRMKVPAMVAGMLDNKIAGIRENLDSAARLRTEAEALKAEYEARARDAAKDAETLKAAAEEEAKLIVAKAKADATALIARRAKSAEEKIAAAERAAIADVRAHAAATASAAATSLIAANHDARADKSLVNETIAALN
jgi:F-type H+-transporting ATPase subunit b